MGIAVGVIGVQPSEFYRLTMAEYWAIFEAYVEANSTKEAVEPCTEEELEEIRELDQRLWPT